DRPVARREAERLALPRHPAEARELAPVAAALAVEHVRLHGAIGRLGDARLAGLVGQDLAPTERRRRVGDDVLDAAVDVELVDVDLALVGAVPPRDLGR